MYTKLVLLGALLLILAIPDNTANAGLLDWVSRDNDNAYIVKPELSMDRIYDNVKGFSLLTKDEIAEDEKIAKELEKEVRAKPAIKKQPTKSAVTKRTMVVMATAYSSTPDQTDSTPFITAWNTHVRDGIIAANFLPFGTKIRIPDMYGDKIFTVEDRMNRRYEYRIDVWFPEREAAMEFGLRKVRIEVI